jgi:3-oxoacyl-[acyl-carrier-protein] synthase II
MLAPQRAYIVDYELVSPLLDGGQSMIESLRSGFSADRPLQQVDVSAMPFKTGAEITENLQPFYAIEPDAVKRLCAIDRKFELITAAVLKANDRLQPLLNLADPQRTGVILGVGADAAPYDRFEKEISDFLRQRMNPLHELNLFLNRNSSPPILAFNNPYDVYGYYLASKLKARRFQRPVLTACVASTQAIAFGFDAIARNECDVVFAGGTDSIINMLAIISFGKLGVIVESDQQVSCRPFDINRSGTVAGEAAGFLVMVSESFLKKNKLEPIASVCGYGNTLDGYKITAPDPSGIQMARAIEQAVLSSGIPKNRVDYIQAHGTGTRQNDATELGAIKRAFGALSAEIPVSGTKDRHGHAIAAAGIQEVCVLLECMKHRFLPGNLNMKQPIAADMNLLRENVSKQIDYALTCNFAFGGINTVLALKNELQ